jgi:Zn-dependent peptidase ImmA (M78 family)
MQKIYEIAENEEIYIAYEDLQRAGDIQGLYTVHPRAGPVIILDQSLPSQYRLHRCVAAHELGHHFYPPRTDASTVIAFYRSNYYTNNSQKEIVISQDEQKALRWATELLMPSGAVWLAIGDGCNTLPLLADFFHVERWFVRAKIGYLRREERLRGTSLSGETLLKKAGDYGVRPLAVMRNRRNINL